MAEIEDGEVRKTEWKIKWDLLYEIEGEVEVVKVGQRCNHLRVDGDQVVGAEVHRGQGGVV